MLRKNKVPFRSLRFEFGAGLFRYRRNSKTVGNTAPTGQILFTS